MVEPVCVFKFSLWAQIDCVDHLVEIITAANL